MAEIPLTQGQVAIVDDEDYAWLSQWKWSAVWIRYGFVALQSENNIAATELFGDFAYPSRLR